MPCRASSRLSNGWPKRSCWPTCATRNASRLKRSACQALQIENSLGSIYSILTTEFQVPYVARKLDILTRAGKVPKMDDSLVKPVMTVGLAAVGRGNDLEQLVRFTNTWAKPSDQKAWRNL